MIKTNLIDLNGVSILRLQNLGWGLPPIMRLALETLK